MEDETSLKIRTPKLVSQLYPREIYPEMLKQVDQGGFYGARNEDGRVLISETAMRRHWPNWIVQMKKRYKAICGCDGCASI